MAKVYLIRHGKVDGEPALYGHTDVEVPSSENQLICELLEKQGLSFSKVISSPLARCQKLAVKLAEKHACSLQLENKLKEMNFGQFDGVPFDSLYKDDEVWRQFERFWENPVQHPLPKSELLTGFSYRVIEAWHQVISQLNHHDQVLIVCHGGVIRMILAYLLNVDFRNPHWYTQLSIANGSLTSIDIRDNNVRVKEIAKPLIENYSLADGKNSIAEVFPHTLLNTQFETLTPIEGHK